MGIGEEAPPSFEGGSATEAPFHTAVRGRIRAAYLRRIFDKQFLPAEAVHKIVAEGTRSCAGGRGGVRTYAGIKVARADATVS